VGGELTMITTTQIKPFYKQGIDYEKAEPLKAKLAGLRSERRPIYLTSAEFDEILHWKLREQYGQQKRLRKSNTEDIIHARTGLALNIVHSDMEYKLVLQVDILCALRSVDAPVASTVLVLIFPEEYAVIDFRAWRQLFDQNGTGFTTTDYQRYMHKIRPLAKELGWPVQEVDHAISEYNERNNLGIVSRKTAPRRVPGQAHLPPDGILHVRIGLK